MLYTLMMYLAFLAPIQQGGDEGGGLIAALVQCFCTMILLVIILGSLYKIFEKAGMEGWKGLIPIYNIYLMLEKIGRPGWWVLLFLIPFVNLIVGIIFWIEVAQAFGKGPLFGLGLTFLSFIFLPWLAFDDSKFIGPKPLF